LRVRIDEGREKRGDGKGQWEEEERYSLFSLSQVEYTPEHVQGGGEPHHTLLFAGKGVTYDTGGADLKINGGMAGIKEVS